MSADNDKAVQNSEDVVTQDDNSDSKDGILDELLDNIDIRTQNSTEISSIVGTKNGADIGSIVGTDNGTDISSIVSTENSADIGSIVGTENGTDISSIVGTQDGKAVSLTQIAEAGNSQGFNLNTSEGYSLKVLTSILRYKTDATKILQNLKKMRRRANF